MNGFKINLNKLTKKLNSEISADRKGRVVTSGLCTDPYMITSLTPDVLMFSISSSRTISNLKQVIQKLGNFFQIFGEEAFQFFVNFGQTSDKLYIFLIHSQVLIRATQFLSTGLVLTKSR